MAKKVKSEPAAELTTVRFTFDPSIEHEVDAATLLDATRQGLIYHGDAPAAPALVPDESTENGDELADEKKGVAP